MSKLFHATFMLSVIGAMYLPTKGTNTVALETNAQNKASQVASQIVGSSTHNSAYYHEAGFAADSSFDSLFNNIIEERNQAIENYQNAQQVEQEQHQQQTAQDNTSKESGLLGIAGSIIDGVGAAVDGVTTAVGFGSDHGDVKDMYAKAQADAQYMLQTGDISKYADMMQENAGMLSFIEQQASKK